MRVVFRNRWRENFLGARYAKGITFMFQYFKNLNGYGMHELSLVFANFQVTLFWGGNR